MHKYFGKMYEYQFPDLRSWIISPCIVNQAKFGKVYIRSLSGDRHQSLTTAEFEDLYRLTDIQPVQLTIPVHTPDDGLNRPTYTLHDQISSHLPENKKQEQEQPGCGIEQGQQFPLF